MEEHTFEGEKQRPPKQPYQENLPSVLLNGSADRRGELSTLVEGKYNWI